MRADEVQKGIDDMADRFSHIGFELHEFTGVETASVILGLEVGVEVPGVLRTKRERVWRLRSALRWLGEGAWVTGDQVRVLLGMYVAVSLVPSGVVSTTVVVRLRELVRGAASEALGLS